MQRGENLINSLLVSSVVSITTRSTIVTVRCSRSFYAYRSTTHSVTAATSAPAAAVGFDQFPDRFVVEYCFQIQSALRQFLRPFSGLLVLFGLLAAAWLDSRG